MISIKQDISRSRRQLFSFIQDGRRIVYLMFIEGDIRHCYSSSIHETNYGWCRHCLLHLSLIEIRNPYRTKNSLSNLKGKLVIRSNTVHLWEMRARLLFMCSIPGSNHRWSHSCNSTQWKLQLRCLVSGGTRAAEESLPILRLQFGNNQTFFCTLMIHLHGSNGWHRNHWWRCGCHRTWIVLIVHLQIRGTRRKSNRWLNTRWVLFLLLANGR